MNDILIEYIRQHLLGGRSQMELSAEDDLLGSGLVDSIGMMKLITFIEGRFDLRVPPEDMTIENFMTIGDIGNYLERRNSA